MRSLVVLIALVVGFTTRRADAYPQYQLSGDPTWACLDVNLHWFTSSHLEWLLTTRLELLDLGSGTNGGCALVQLHYRS